MTTSDKPLAEGPSSERTMEFEASRTVWDKAARPETLDDPVVGRLLGGRFRVLRRIGEGGMGAVYEIVDPDGQKLAAKVISVETVAKTAPAVARGLTSDAEWKRALRRFVREAAAAREVQSEHVVKTLELEVDEDLGLPFIVMELLNGIDLAELIHKEAPLPPEVVARIGVEAAKGLAAVHAAGIVHRDVKPSNIFLHLDVDRVTVKVCDFGIAKQLASAPEQTSSELTHTGGVLGSPRYMSPEQVTSARDVDATTDVYSLCASLYEATSGRALWSGRASLGELILAICTERPADLANAAPWVPQQMAAAIHRGLSRSRAQRWQEMPALVEALSPHAGEGPVRSDRLRRLDPSLAPAPSLELAEPLASADALAESFETQGVRPAVALSAVLPTPVPAAPEAAPAERRYRYAIPALVALGIAGVIAWSATLAKPPRENPAPVPARLQVAPADVRVSVNGSPGAVREGQIELSGQPGDSFEVVLERAGQQKHARVLITSSGGVYPPRLELAVAPQAAVAAGASSAPVPAAPASAAPRAPKAHRSAPREPAASKHAPGESTAVPLPPAPPKTAPTVLRPVEQW
jgi:serine/threonine-protein kinase